MAKKKNPILTLSSEIERDFILIDGEPCTIKSKSELSMVDYHWLKSRGNKTTELFNKDELTDEEATELLDTVHKLADFIFIDTPKETIDKLSEGQKFEIITTFTKLLTADSPAGAIEQTDTQ